MISARQIKNILDYSFTTAASTSGTAPTATFSANPAMYSSINLPSSVALTGTITPNSGLNITWVILNNSGGILTTGSGTNVNVGMTGSMPTAIGSYTYTLVVTYQNTAGSSFTVSFPTLIQVTAMAEVGQMLLPGDDINIPGDLTGPLEATFATKDSNQIINLFSIVAANTGKIVIVLPYSYGAVVDISDNTDSSVLSQFKLVDDPSNSRSIYVSYANLTPATYHYKIVY